MQGGNSIFGPISHFTTFGALEMMFMYGNILLSLTVFIIRELSELHEHDLIKLSETKYQYKLLETKYIKKTGGAFS